MSKDISEHIVPFPAAAASADSTLAWRQVSASLRRLFSDFSKAKPRILPRLLHEKRHASLLSGLPHHCICDLAVCYVVLLVQDDSQTACAYLSNEHLAAWPGVTEKDLFAAALENGPKLLPAVRLDITDPSSWPTAGAVYEEGGENDPLANAPFDAPHILAVTNCRQQYGASAVLYPGELSKLADAWQDDLLLLPSSVHEMLALPASEFASSNPDPMIREINASVLQPEDILSDHSYRYVRQYDRILLPNRPGR